MQPNLAPLAVEGLTVLLTGGFGLIGKTVGLGYLRAGAKVALADVNTAVIPELQAELEGEFDKGQFLLLELDITKEESCEAAIAALVHAWGRVDVLVNNAAIDAKFDASGMSQVNQSRFENYPIDLLRRSVEVNLTGTVIMSQAACRQMLRQGSGNIINVASTYSMVAPNQSLYDFGHGVENYKPVDYIASKSFIPNFTRYLATFYAREGIRCNAVVPHGIFNNHPEAFLVNWAKLSPLGRMCDRDELVGPFLFLAGPGSSYMTGAVLMVDGGWTAW